MKEFVNLKKCAVHTLGCDKTKMLLFTNTKCDDPSLCCNRKYDILVIVNSNDYNNDGLYQGVPLYRFDGEFCYNIYSLLSNHVSLMDIISGKHDWECRQAWLNTFDEETKNLAVSIEKEILGMNDDIKLTSEFAWKVYNFINDYKSGQFGVVSLQKAINEHFALYK